MGKKLAFNLNLVYTVSLRLYTGVAAALAGAGVACATLSGKGWLGIEVTRSLCVKFYKEFLT